MAASVPASLKSADINRFALRAHQLEKAKPAVAYWCNYWIAQQILSKGLHDTDDESQAYTTSLVGKLEQMKRDNANDDALTDDIAGKALVEQFGLEVFQKADNAMKADKVTRQTADTFQAGATFLELLQIWAPLEPEHSQKIKFAKYHALRIAKALKAGEDPNLTNPKPEPEPEPETALLDPDDPEVRALGGLGSPAELSASQPHHAFAEDVPDEHDRMAPSLAQHSTLDESLHPSRAPSAPPPGQGAPLPHQHTPPAAENFYQTSGHGDVSPLGPESADRAPSIGGGYFPRVPDEDQSSRPMIPDVPTNAPGQPFVSLGSPSAPSLLGPQDAPPSAPYQPDIPSPTGAVPYHQPRPHVGVSSQGPSGFQSPYQQPSIPPQPPAQSPYNTAPWAQPPPPKPPAQAVEVNDEAIAKARKHAKFAQSALDFEDVPTAISQLKDALKTLGAL